MIQETYTEDELDALEIIHEMVEDGDDFDESVAVVTEALGLVSAAKKLLKARNTDARMAALHKRIQAHSSDLKTKGTMAYDDSRAERETGFLNKLAANRPSDLLNHKNFMTYHDDLGREQAKYDTVIGQGRRQIADQDGKGDERASLYARASRWDTIAAAMKRGDGKIGKPTKKTGKYMSGAGKGMFESVKTIALSEAIIAKNVNLQETGETEEESMARLRTILDMIKTSVTNGSTLNSIGLDEDSAALVNLWARGAAYELKESLDTINEHRIVEMIDAFNRNLEADSAPKKKINPIVESYVNVAKNLERRRAYHDTQRSFGEVRDFNMSLETFITNSMNVGKDRDTIISELIAENTDPMIVRGVRIKIDKMFNRRK